MTISGRVDTWFETKFSNKVRHKFQQEMSRLRGRVFTDTDVKEKTYKIPVFGKAQVTKNKPSHNDQDPQTGGHTRPSVSLDDYTTGRYVGYMDQEKLGTTLEDAYQKAQAAACGRELDKIILDAVDTATTSGNSNINETSGGLTYEKVVAATKHFYKNVVGQTAGRKTIVIDEEGWEDLANESEFKNSDFVAYRVAETGEVPMVSGHEVVVIDPNLVPNRDVTTAPSFAFAFHENAVVCPINVEITTEINKIPQKFSDFIGTYFAAAAVTALNEGVYRIDVGQS